MKDLESVVGGFVFVLLFVLLFLWARSCSNRINSEINKYEDAIGDTVVFKGDTLIVIDFSFVNNTLILDNGTSVNINLLNKIK